MRNAGCEMGNDGAVYDVIVIGGGITGAGAARDAALRGLSCLLLEKGDFASGVSSKSTRLIHGGLRYFANFEFDLVAEALRERAVLRRMAPYLIHPIPILIPIYRGDPHGRLLVSLGVHLYELLSHEKDIPHYFTTGREKTLALEPRLNTEGLKGSAVFYDHQVMMPERLVIENVISAREAGAAVRNYVCVEKIEEGNESVSVTARETPGSRVLTFRAKVLINAAGPWIDKVRRSGSIDEKKIIFPTKGIHLVVRKLSDQALFVASRDNRMFFIVPLGDNSLIGTTDTRYNGDLDEVHAVADDVDYLLEESRRVLPGLNLTHDAILYTYAGVRPLAFSGKSESRISRKHRVIPEGKTGRVITIAGGKLTTYRNMAKDAVDAACKAIGKRMPCITDKRPFPGGLLMPYEDYVKERLPAMKERYGVSAETIRHLIRYYGSRAGRVLDLVRMEPGLGERISLDGPDIYAQVVYSALEEGARTLSDIVLRRMPLGMTSSRGRDHAKKIAEVAARELKWSDEEARHQVQELLKELDKDTECLRSFQF